MQDTDKKQNNFLKKLKELDLKIDIEKEKVKHNNLIKEEFENINASYNRCLDILSRSATGKNINPKYNELYSKNRSEFYKTIDYLDSQNSQLQKNINAYLEEREVIRNKSKEEKESN